MASCTQVDFVQGKTFVLNVRWITVDTFYKSELELDDILTTGRMWVNEC